MCRCVVFLIAFAIAFPIAAQSSSPPSPPRIHEPAEGAQVSGEDVHMVAGGFSDADGDEHLCTDWEIVDAVEETTAWSALCVTGFLANHIHLGDGTFAPALDQGKRLLPSRDYRLRVRFRDDSRSRRDRSEWSEHGFRTTPVKEIAAMVIVDVLISSPPRWIDSSGDPVILPASSQSFMRLETATGAELFEIRSLDGTENQWLDEPPVDEHHPLRVTIGSGASQEALDLPHSRFVFFDEDRAERTIHLPEIDLAPGEEQILWISSNGSSHVGASFQDWPDFSAIARANPIPWNVNESGYVVELVADGFQLPVAIEPVLDPGSSPDDPLLYVAELYGAIRVISRDGSVNTYAENLLNFDPFGDFPGSGERGVADLALEPSSGDLFATLPYRPAGSDGFQPRVIRLVSSSDGRMMVDVEVVLDLPEEWIGPSHQISNISIGADDKLYVHIADGSCIPCARDPRSARGKILRLEHDGSAPEDNPFHDPTDGITATDLIYAMGFRNPFGGAWRAADDYLYQVENGPAIDRFARVEPGADYGWEGEDEDMFIGALYTWIGGPVAAPVNIAFVQPETFGGSGFPWWKQDTAYVSESGPTWATGPTAAGKRIGEFIITGAGELGGERRTFVEYSGTGKSTVAALAAAADGLYFSDLYQDDELSSPVAPGAKVFRVRHVGSASFEVTPLGSEAGCGAVSFVDTSTLDGLESWRWRFGDGAESSDQNPVHQYAECGPHVVELLVKGPEGERSRSVTVDVGSYGGIGLTGEYFSDEELSKPAFRRIDPVIGFDPDGPGQGDGDGYSVRWTGHIRAPVSQPYRFRLEGTGRGRLWIDGRVVADDRGGTGRSRSGRIELMAGDFVKIQVEAVSEGNDTIGLVWGSESHAEEIVPSRNLYPGSSSRRRAVRR